MSEQVLAAADLTVGEHPEWHFLGLTFNIDTIVGMLIASAIVLGLGFAVRAKITSGPPGGIQLFFETITSFIRSQIESTLGVRVAPFLVPLSLALFVFILTSNWLALLPVHQWLAPPTADVNMPYALAILVFLWMHIEGARRHGGPGKHFLHVAKGHYAPLAPLWLLEQVTNTVALALRLFGNIFAGSMLLSIIALLPSSVSWLPNAGWKLFDMFIGFVHATIFVLLTIVYFSEQVQTDSDAAH